VKQGSMERALEYVISVYPISAKHNPYYGGSFNGNDCMHILENVPLLFQSLFHATGSNETATVIIQNHFDIWESFAAIVPLLRSRRKFTPQEQHDFILDTAEFSNQYKTKSSSNVTYKMHLLFAHMQGRLSTYHTIGLFSEDSMESIHAFINRLDRVYVSLDSERKTKAILQSITATKKRSVAIQSNKLSKSDSAGNEMLQKQKRRQGVAKKSKSVSGEFIDMTALLAPAATIVLRNWTWTSNDIKEDDYPGLHMNYNEILCGHCKEHLNCDERISSQLADLHYLLRHVHTDSKLMYLKQIDFFKHSFYLDFFRIVIRASALASHNVLVISITKGDGKCISLNIWRFLLSIASSQMLFSSCCERDGSIVFSTLQTTIRMHNSSNDEKG
jgi:hypothetical protein